MGVTRLRDNVSQIVEGVLRQRADATDEVEWDVTLGFDTDLAEEENTSTAVVLIYVALDCPESADEGGGPCKSVVQYGVPLRFYTPEVIRQVTNEVWDRMVVNRLSEANGFDTPRLGDGDP